MQPPWAGPGARIVQRLLALNACIWHNWIIGAPVKRSLIAYDHQLIHRARLAQMPTGIDPPQTLQYTRDSVQSPPHPPQSEHVWHSFRPYSVSATRQHGVQYHIPVLVGGCSYLDDTQWKSSATL